MIFSISGLFLILMAWSSHSYLKQLHQAFDSFTNKSLPVFNDVQVLRLASLKLLINAQYLLEHKAATNPQRMQELRTQVDSLNQIVKDYETSVNSDFPDEKHYLSAIKKQLGEFLLAVDASKIASKDNAAAIDTANISKRLLQTHASFSKALDQAYLHESQEFKTNKKQTELAISEMNNFTLWRLALGLMLLAALAFLSLNLLSSALLRMKTSSQLLVAENLPTENTHQSNDEITVFENHFYRIAKQLREFNDEQQRLHAQLKNEIEEKKQALQVVHQHEQLLSTQVTERTRELQIAKSRAEQANAAKTTFLANMSHEIRTPLNAVIGLTRVLQQQAVSLPVDDLFRGHLERIRQGGEVLLATVNTILDITKIETGKMPLLVEDFSLEDTLLDICSIFETQAQQKDVVLKRVLDPSLRMMVRTDRTKLMQITNNLLGNAIKFTPAGGMVTLHASRKNHLLTLKVSDNGIGIPADRLKAIFQPFEQADDSITRQHGGSGLGLAIAQRLTELLNGQISVTSHVDEGSEFTVRLPLEFIASTRLSPKSRDDNEEIVWANIDILVVEDNQVNQAVIDAMLRSFGANVKLSSSGSDAIEALKHYTPDLILMDLHMPGMSGLDTTRLILSDNATRHIPIIALSADALVDQQSNAKAVGMVDYLIKPVDLSNLRYTLRKHLLKRNAVA
jgi:signal transduction histidine kinase/ActR/RegA family two-component response regulator